MPSYSALSPVDAGRYGLLFGATSTYDIAALMMGPTPIFPWDPNFLVNTDFFSQVVMTGDYNQMGLNLTFAQRLQALSDWRYYMIPFLQQLGGLYP
jgi:hypothetical protein